MKTSQLALTLGIVIAAGAAHAAGPLYLSTETGQLTPLVWDTTNGAIPAYTDGGGAFTYDFDGTTPFITIERANEITANALLQWSQVPTSTFEATVAGTIADQAGVGDVDSSNVDQFIGVENGLGFWVLYDTDGSILEDYFGVDKYSVLGIAFPEFSDGEGTIIEATAVLNGWAVSIDDPQADMFAGVFTHEIGHTINLSHSQVNGPMAYQSYPYAGMEMYPGVPKCPGVEPYIRYDSEPTDGMHVTDPASIETMFPFVEPYGQGGAEQASINLPDDIAGISNLYPTSDYLSSRGSISGVLQLKDGSMEYSGVNVIARNANNLMFDAVSAMTGDQTQGLVGPDGRFTIHNLTPGQQYVLYIESITSGGYPTTPQPLISEREYWNTGEGRNPATDNRCGSTPITAVAGVTKQADFTFNGYLDGVQFTPIVDAYLISLSDNGNRAGGIAGYSTPFIWDRQRGIELLPVGLNTYQGNMDKSGMKMAVQIDPDGNGIQEPAIWRDDILHILGRGDGTTMSIGDLNGNTCGGSSQSGLDSAVLRGLDDDASTAIGLAYIDIGSDGSCEGEHEAVPFIWDAPGGMRQLDVSVSSGQPWTRANAVSGDGRVVIGNANFSQAVAWVNEGPEIDLTAFTGAIDANAINHDGSVVPLSGYDWVNYKNTGIITWNALMGTGPDAFTNIDSLRYCIDVPYMDWFGQDMCAQYTPDEVFDMVGSVPVNVFGSSASGDVLVGRAGDFFTGFTGAIWVKGMGWMTIAKFLHRQGVTEAEETPFDNPIAINATGQVIAGGITGVEKTWLIDAKKVYVCQRGSIKSQLVGFPGEMVQRMMLGAKFGRCEFQD